MLLDKWHTKFIGEGGGFAVSRKPHPLSENDGTMNKAIRLILNEEKHLLPIIYVSMTRSGRYQMNPEILAAVFTGVAHVFFETAIPGMYQTSSRCAHNGTIAVYPVDGSFPMMFKCNEVPREKLIEMISASLRKYMMQVRIPYEDTFLEVRGKALDEENKILHEDNETVRCV